MKDWDELAEKVEKMKCGEYIIFNHHSGIYKLTKTEDVSLGKDGVKKQ